MALSGCGGLSKFSSGDSASNQAPALAEISCTAKSLTGAQATTCSVSLSSPSSRPVSVRLHASDSAIFVPGSVQIKAAESTVGFTALSAGVSSSQSATISATLGKDSVLYALALYPAAKPVLDSMSCKQSAILGAGTDVCQLTLSGPAPSGGTSVALTSSSGALTVPSSVLVPATVTSAAFTAAAAPVSSNQSTSVTARANGSSKSFQIELDASDPAITISASSLQFGKVALHTSVAKTLVLSSTGTAPLVISSGAIIGTGFTVSGANFPISLNPGQSLTLSVWFNPVTAGTTTGQLILNTNSASNPVASISFSGTVGSSGATNPTLLLGTSNISFGNVPLHSTVSKSVVLTSTGTAPLVINSGVVNGSGFKISGVTFPLSLNPGQSVVLSIAFSPTSSGATTGQLTIDSNSSTGPSAAVQLSGTGTSTPPSLTSLHCDQTAFTGIGADGCLVGLSAAPGAVGTTMNLASSNSAVTVPSSIAIPALSTAVSFTANVAKVASAQSAVITATIGSSSTSFTIKLNAALPVLSINATTISFGSTALHTPTSQSVTLSSTGNYYVTIKSATITGTGFSLSGVDFPLTLVPGQSVVLSLQFDPAASGAASGQLAIASDSSTNPNIVIDLTGTGTGSAHRVQLNWNPPADLTVPVAGYNVYRAQSGTQAYSLLNPGIVAAANYLDLAVVSGQSYDYYVRSVSPEGIESGPSNTTTVSVP